ncbi:DUF3781 domain-containing protein [Actinomycetaceae bacterium MB13-C1-2]|nr:DUF3781 domain-containing protein [Actinomycetaceae bacterium MB13-C1-2]
MFGLDRNKLHTTELGVERIRRNLSLSTDDVVTWCQEVIASHTTDDSCITQRGKNWYVDCGDCIITVNAHSHTIITAHRK